jgi:hypothetical protein
MLGQWLTPELLGTGCHGTNRRDAGVGQCREANRHIGAGAL